MADSNESKLYLDGKPVEGFVENHEHVSPVSMYLKILGALFVLTGLTYAVSYMNLGPASLPVAMIVATMKATLVAAFFMHLKYEDRFHVFIFVGCLLFVGIFFLFTIFDLSSRDRLHEVQATDYLRNEGSWDDMKMMSGDTANNKPACTDGTIPMCEETFAVCNPEGAHHGEDMLVRKIANGCFVSQMVPKVDEKGVPVLGEDRKPVMVDAGCVSAKLACTNPHTAEGVKAAAAAAAAANAPAAPAEGDAKAPAEAKADAKAPADAKAAK